MNLKKLAEKQEKLAKEWNEKHPVGTVVDVTKDDRTVVRTKTTRGATVLGGHTAVAWLEGFRGCYDLSRVKAVRT